MRFFTLLTALFFAVQTYAQNVKGYYVNYEGKRIEGSFKQADFTNLSALEFQQSSNKGYIKLSPDLVKEYGVGDEFKFEKHMVRIDVSQSGGTEKGFQWSEDAIFLNVVVEGDATLYSYSKEYFTKYFLKTKEMQKPEQLMFKKYKAADGNIVDNNGFRQQLYNKVKCPGQTEQDFSDVLYDRKQLIDIIKNYNKSQGVKSEEYHNGLKRESGFSYTVFAGIYNLNFGIKEINPTVDGQNNVNYGFGGEVAYTFRSEKVTLFAGVEYELMSSEVVNSYRQSFNTMTTTFKMDSNAFNFYFGPRYNFIFNDRNKLFIDTALGMSIPFGDIDQTTVITTDVGESYPGASDDYNLKPCFYLNFGFGYTFDRYGVAIRYRTGRDFLEDVNSTYKTNITSLGVIFRYTFK